MFKSKAKDEKNNLCEGRISALRCESNPKMSQRMLADKLQLMGLDIDKNAVQRIECGKRFVTDIELAALCKVFQCSGDYMLFGKNHRSS